MSWPGYEMSGYELSWYEMFRYEMSEYEMSVPLCSATTIYSLGVFCITIAFFKRLFNFFTPFTLLTLIGYWAMIFLESYGIVSFFKNLLCF